MHQKQLYILVGLFAIFAVASIYVFFYRLSDTSQFLREHRKLEAIYPHYEAAKQSEVPPEIWEEAWGWTQTAIVNVCSPGHVDINELSHFRKQLEEKLNQPIGVETLCWIWNELERIEPTGQYGNNYVKRYKLVFLQSLMRGGQKC